MCLKKNGAWAVFLLLVNVSALADQQDSWNLVVGGTLMNDSNLFRAPAGKESSDQISAANAGVRVNKAYSLQRFVVDASVTDFRYRDNSYLNYLGKNLSASWLWSLTPQLHGNLSTGYSESLNSFVDYFSVTPELRKNMRTLSTQRFDLEWEAMGRLRLIGGVNYTDLKNSQVFLEDSDYIADAAEYGLKYVLPSGSQMSVLGRNANGEYKKRVINASSKYDSGFSQRDLELRFLWVASEKSRFNGRVAYINREHDHFAERDYKGTVGSLDYIFDLTSKTRLTFGVKRDLVSYQASYQAPFPYNISVPYSYYQLDSYNISPVWQITQKTALRARYSHETRDYRGAAQSVFKDTLRQSSVSLDWSPLRTLTLSASVQRDTRDSMLAARAFSSNMVNLSANLVF